MAGWHRELRAGLALSTIGAPIPITGAAINYLFVAFASNLWMLLVRAIAGLTSAKAAPLATLDRYKINSC